MFSSPPALAADDLNDMLEVNAVRDQFGAGSPHGPQRFLAALVDDRYFSEIHHAFARLVPAALLPAGLELLNPRLRQAALKNPSLFIAALSDRDPQHCVPSVRGNKRTPYANLVGSRFSPEMLS
jgi:hypothetical protein